MTGNSKGNIMENDYGSGIRIRSPPFFAKPVALSGLS
jgi:hypothetical protein